MASMASAGLFAWRSKSSNAVVETCRVANPLLQQTNFRGEFEAHAASFGDLARSQRRLPLMVLISPLCATKRNG